VSSVDEPRSDELWRITEERDSWRRLAEMITAERDAERARADRAEVERDAARQGRDEALAVNDHYRQDRDEARAMLAAVEVLCDRAALWSEIGAALGGSGQETTE
jgi:uncharacterized coiled-coil DUF342 family protein